MMSIAKAMGSPPESWIVFVLLPPFVEQGTNGVYQKDRVHDASFDFVFINLFTPENFAHR